MDILYNDKILVNHRIICSNDYFYIFLNQIQYITLRRAIFGNEYFWLLPIWNALPIDDVIPSQQQICGRFSSYRRLFQRSFSSYQRRYYLASLYWIDWSGTQAGLSLLGGRPYYFRT